MSVERLVRLIAEDAKTNKKLTQAVVELLLMGDLITIDGSEDDVGLRLAATAIATQYDLDADSVLTCLETEWRWQRIDLCF